MNNLICHQVNLKNNQERKYFSYKLQDMEKEFLYPLGKEQFFIQHGKGNYYDYFSYFEQLGTPYFYSIEKENKTIGSICFVLRHIENKKVWYICDLKVIKEEQSKRITFILYNILKNKLNNICNSFYFVNMCSIKNNGLFKIADKVLKGFKMDVKNLYFYEITKNNIYVKNKVILTNNNKKDIIVNQIPQKLYHAADNNVFERTSNTIIENINEIDINDNIMFCSFDEIKNLECSNIGIFVSCGIDQIKGFSSFEI